MVKRIASQVSARSLTVTDSQMKIARITEDRLDVSEKGAVELFHGVIEDLSG